MRPLRSPAQAHEELNATTDHRLLAEAGFRWADKVRELETLHRESAVRDVREEA